MDFEFITHLWEFLQICQRWKLEKLSTPKTVCKHLNCLSILEKYKALIYSKVSDLFEQPFAKSLLLSISQDSTKHSTLLRGIANSISSVRVKVSDCPEYVGELYGLVGNCINELTSNRRETLDFSQLVQMLGELESTFGEEYSGLLQGSSLRLVVKGISPSCNVNVESVKDVFESIFKDEERHFKLLKTIKGMIPESSIAPEIILRKEKPAKKSGTPEVKYQNPDAWVCALPPATYDST